MNRASFLIVAILLLSGFKANSQTSDVNLKNAELVRVPYQPTNCDRLRDYFRDTLSMYGKPGGIIMTNGACSRSKGSPEAEQGELYERLNAVMQVESGFVWSEDSGVMNLLPAGTESSLVDTKLSEFKITVGDELSMVLKELRRRPEFLERMKELNLKEPSLEIGGGLQSPPSNRPKQEFTFIGKTIREILNEIVRKRGRGIWLYDEHNYNGNNTYRLVFLGP